MGGSEEEAEMRNRSAPLALALCALLVFAGIAYMRAESADRSRPAAAVEAARSPAPAEASPQTAAPAGDSHTPGAEGQAAKTGCGKPVPCPNRSCEDCPNNVRLK